MSKIKLKPDILAIGALKLMFCRAEYKAARQGLRKVAVYGANLLFSASPFIVFSAFLII